MRVIFVSAMCLGLSVFSTVSVAVAQDLKCRTPDQGVSVSLVSDGGEETMLVSKDSATERYLVLFHDSSKIVAMNDSALGNISNRGAILSLNTYGKNYLSYDGQVLVLDCH